MTTIAFDGETLASDTQSSLFRLRVRKICRLPDGRLFGSCGRLSDNVAVAKWMIDGGEKPKVEDSFHGIVVTGRHHFYGLEATLEPLLYDGMGMFAIGSGRDFALMAMYLGKSAGAAVVLASKFDVDTGHDIEELKAP